ncbi:BZ3501_MvSof-1269-A2-R1_C55g00302 [Microbotryum saponariae]|nr:BZ3501_MvSof-1269-A2-R1_C55g00302 [Microbotryum saponariae]
MSVVQIARWPTRWQPSFAPNRSVTCRPYSAAPSNAQASTC